MLSSAFSPSGLDELRRQFREAQPFPFIAVDEFLEPEFARELATAYPSYKDARALGREFTAINEKNKVQITDPSSFPKPVEALHELLSSSEFLSHLEYITGIDGLLADPNLAGGGMHITGPRGRLDVHVDFNYVEASRLHRRLNILIYLNDGWKDEWGGAVELWDRDVRTCVHSFKPVLNRCVVFETSDISFHGVEPVTCPQDVQRISFAAYYYTKEAPAAWDGTKHSTVFKARPTERLRHRVLVPLEKARHRVVPSAKQLVKNIIGWDSRR